MDAPDRRGEATTVLQAVVFPNLEVHADPDMYVRLGDRAFCDMRADCSEIIATEFLG